MFDELQRMNGFLKAARIELYSHSWLVQCSYSSVDRASKGNEARNVQILLAMVAQIQILRLNKYEFVVCANTAYSLPSSTTMRCFLMLDLPGENQQICQSSCQSSLQCFFVFLQIWHSNLQKVSLGIFRTAVLQIINEQLSVPVADIVHSAQIFYHRHCSAELRI